MTTSLFTFDRRSAFRPAEAGWQSRVIGRYTRPEAFLQMNELKLDDGLVMCVKKWFSGDDFTKLIDTAGKRKTLAEHPFLQEAYIQAFAPLSPNSCSRLKVLLLVRQVTSPEGVQLLYVACLTPPDLLMTRVLYAMARVGPSLPPTKDFWLRYFVIAKCPDGRTFSAEELDRMSRDPALSGCASEE